jgi:hypothetical protein
VSQILRNVVINPAKSFPKSFSTTDASVRAILIYKNRSAGAVRVTRPNAPQPVPNIMTRPDKISLEIIEVKDGQTYIFFSNPIVQFFQCKEA